MKYCYTSQKQTKQSGATWKMLILIFIILNSLVIKMSAQETTVSGNVVDEKSQPLTGVNVVVKGKTVGTVTDIDGKFSINAASTDVLVFSFMGYKTEEIAIGNQTQFNLALKEEITQVNEVVVVGYGVQRKSDLTGAVASVKAQELKQIATTNISQALEGRVAGVTVTSTSGEPGAGMQVRIRGVGTINNSDPLYVVDGFPVGDINFLGPNDIESMEILKDASATAIYGNRGANGVVIITTKKGNEQTTSITFSTYTGIEKVNRTIPVCNAHQFAEAKLLAYANVKQKMGADSTLMKTIAASNEVGTDWQKEIMRQGIIHNYSLNVTGGTGKSKFDISGQYNSEDGIIKNSFLKQYFLRFGNQYEFSKHFKGEVSISYVQTKKTNYDYNIYSGPLPEAVRIDPITPVYNPQTDSISPLNPNNYAYSTISEIQNPVASVDRMKTNINKDDRFVGNFGLEVKLIKGLTFTTKYGADYDYQNNYRYMPDFVIGAKDQNEPSYLFLLHGYSVNWTNSNYLNYSNDFGKSSVNFMIGQETSLFSYHKTEATVFGVPADPNLMYATAATNPTAPFVNAVSPNDGTAVGPYNRYDWEATMASYFGRVNYSYDGKYLLTFNIRRDASSKIAEQYRWGTFPSFSVGWNIKQEEFMKDLSFLSALKLRVGWGKTGNQNSVTDVYALYPTVTPGLWILGQNRAQLEGKIQTVTPNEKLQWEVVTQYNYGVDFGLIKDMLTGTVDLFLKNTSGMIVPPVTPLFAGLTSSRANVGAMENKGLELTLNYRSNIGDFKYEIGGNVSFLSLPMVTKLSDSTQVFTDGFVSKLNPVTKTAQGEDMGHFWGYQTNGLLTQANITDSVQVNGVNRGSPYKGSHPGQLRIVDQNHDGVLTTADKINLGSPYPTFTYGFNVNLMFKGFDVKMFLQGVHGNKIVNSLNAVIKGPVEGDQNLSTDVLTGYQPGVRENATYPGLYQGDVILSTRFSDFYVEDGSYMRIKNLQIGYSLPKKWISKIGMTNFRIYVSADNLLTVTKYTGLDPENARQQYVGGAVDPLTVGIDDAAYPTARKYLVGVTISF